PAATPPAATTPAATAPAATGPPTTPPAGVDPKQYAQALAEFDKLTCAPNAGASASAVAPTSTSPQWTVSLDFKSSGQATWARYTSQHNVTVTPNDPANNVAFVLDGKTISAPAIQGTINGQTQITGSFTQSQAEDLANVLKYGALPLTFQQ